MDMKSNGAPDWPPAGSAFSLADGTRGQGSTGQLFEVRNRQWVRIPHTAESCIGHIASEADPKVCDICGTHIDSLRPDDEQG